MTEEHKLGSTVTIELPESRGGSAELTVVLGSSCTECTLTGLGHSTCQTVRCSMHSRSDGHSIVYKRVEVES